MAALLLILRHADALADGAVGHDRAHDVDEQRQAIALVAAEEHSFAAHGHDAAAGLLGVSGVGLVVADTQEDVRVEAGRAGLVDEHTGLQLMADLGIDLHLAAGHDGRCEVHVERMRVGGDGHGDGVRAEHRLAGVGRDDERLGICHGHAHEALLGSHHGIVTGNTEMVGVTDADHADAVLFCLVDGKLHALDTGKLAHAVVRVDDSHAQAVLYDLGLCIDLDAADIDAERIKGQAVDAVGLDAKAVGGQDDVSDLLAVFPAEAVADEHFHGQLIELFIIVSGIMALVLHDKTLLLISSYLPR